MDWHKKDGRDFVVGSEDNSIGLVCHDGSVHHGGLIVGNVGRLSKDSIVGIHIRTVATSDEHDDEDYKRITALLIINFPINGKKRPMMMMKANNLDICPSTGFRHEGQVVEATVQTESAYDAASKFLSALTDTLHLQKTIYNGLLFDRNKEH